MINIGPGQQEGLELGTLRSRSQVKRLCAPETQDLSSGQQWSRAPTLGQGGNASSRSQELRFSYIFLHPFTPQGMASPGQFRALWDSVTAPLARGGFRSPSLLSPRANRGPALGLTHSIVCLYWMGGDPCEGGGTNPATLQSHR